MRTLIASAALAAGALSLAACGSSSPSSPPAAAAPTATAHSAAPSPFASCKLKDTPTYIVRDDDPGASVMAQDVGNADYASCTTMLSGFAATAGQAQGECTTIALASDNPGYNVNATPAPPLKDVIASAGPGC